MPRFGGRIRGTRKATVVTTGGGGAYGGANSLDIRDSIGSMTARVSSPETNAVQTEGRLAAITARSTETNPVPTETVKANIRPNGDSNAVQTETSTARVNYTATGTWVAPAGVTSVTVQCWGGGQGGAAGSATTGGTGGRGGDFVRSVLAVTPGNTYTVTVGAASAVGANGNSSWFNTATTIRAKGGNNADTNIGTTVFTGGTGAAGAALGTGGGGGEGASSTANGVNAASGTGGASAGDGGNGGNGSTTAGVAGTAPGGGGGGGGGSATSPGAGSAGARGEVRITYTTS